MVARELLRRITPITSGAAYEDTMQKSTAYWECILTKRDATATKKAADEALGRLLGCEAAIVGKEMKGRWKTLKEMVCGWIPRIP